MTRVKSLAGAAIALLLLASCADEPRMIVAESADRYPNNSATDWVTYADHVVVATAVDEEEIPLSDELAEIGEGAIDRNVTMRVDDVIWSSDKPRHAAPARTFQWEAWGWALQDGEKIPMAGHDQPRVEVDNTYVMALLWEEAIDDESSPIPARWVSLGADSVIPYDDKRLGVGELEGVERSAPISVSSSDPNRSLEDELAGQDAAKLADTLAATDPSVREDFGPGQ